MILCLWNWEKGKQATKAKGKRTTSRKPLQGRHKGGRPGGLIWPVYGLLVPTVRADTVRFGGEETASTREAGAHAGFLGKPVSSEASRLVHAMALELPRLVFAEITRG